MDLLTQARQEAEVRTGCRGAALHEGQIAVPAGFRLAKSMGRPPESAAQCIAEQWQETDGQWLSEAEAAGGYVNCALSPRWFCAVVEELLNLPAVELEPLSRDTLRKQDALVCCLLKLSQVEDRSGREDRENAGWLLRYTITRLCRFGQCVSYAPAPEDAPLLILAAELMEQTDPKRWTAKALTLCGAVWEISPQRLSPALAEGLARGLDHGRIHILFKHSAEKQV